MVLASSRSSLFPEGRPHPIFTDLASIISVVTDGDGRVVADNLGFRRLVGRTDGAPYRAAPLFINPCFSDLLSTLPDAGDHAVFTGLVTVLLPSGVAQSFPSATFRLGDGIAWVAEYDPVELERLNAVVLGLNEELACSQRVLVRANRELERERRRQINLVRQLTDAREQLIQLERLDSIGRLAAGLAHEINNPTAAAIANVGTLWRYVADLLRLADAPPDERAPVRAEIDLSWMREDLPALLGDLRGSLDRIKEIVGALRDLARPGESERQVVDPVSLLDDALQLLGSRLDKVHIERPASAVRPAVDCMPALIGQVWLALLDNALQAVHPGGTITVTVGSDSTWVWFQVADDGCGIAPRDLPHVFDPFFTTRPVGSGAGLALYVAWNIVRRHGGRIEVESTPGQGSRFTVSLPRPGPSNPPQLLPPYVPEGAGRIP